MHHTTEPKKGQAPKSVIQKLTEKKHSMSTAADWIKKHLSDNAYVNYKQCGNYLIMLENEERDKQKLDVGFFCKQRLCSGCAWRAAVSAAQCVSAISAAAVNEHKREMLFVTLTIPNVKGHDLREAIRHLYQSWNRMIRRKRYAVWADNIRKLEITYNEQRNDFHPHLHIIVYVKRGYFKTGNYISHQQLLADWRQATRDETITQVNVKKCRDQGTTNAILEVSKYSCKSSDYMKSEQVFDVMYKALHHTRLMTYAGLAADLRTCYNNGELSAYEETDKTKYVWRVVYAWHALASEYIESNAQPYDAAVETVENYQNRLEQQRIDRALDIANANEFIQFQAKWKGWKTEIGGETWEEMIS